MGRALAVAVAAVCVASLPAAARGVPQAAPSPARAAAEAAPVLGIDFFARDGLLAWFDPLTLRPLRGRKVPLARHFSSWSFSADRSLLALGGGETADVRLVDARRMRLLGDVPLGPGEGVGGVSWLRPDRLLALVVGGRAGALAVVDPQRRRVLRRVPLPRPVWEAVRLPDGLVLLLGASGSFRPVGLAVVDADGGVRLATVSRIEIGTVASERAGQPFARTRRPGIAVDPERRRAYVVSAGSELAEVDLDSLAVSYRPLSETVSLLGRLRDWLEPQAQAKLFAGPERTARWLGDGLIAVAGADYSVANDRDGTPRSVSRAAGLRLIDVRTGTVRTLAPGASRLALAGGLLFAEGGSYDATGWSDRIGLVAYDLAGRERYRLYAGEVAWLAAAGSFGYVWRDRRVDVVDLAGGAVLRTLEPAQAERMPTLLAAQSSDY